MTRWRWEQPTASRRRTGWAKTFTSFDASATGAKAFTGGEYLEDNVLREDPKGTLIVQITPGGSIKNSREECQLSRVGDEGLEAISGDFDWRKDWLEIRDAALTVLELSAGCVPRCPHCGGEL